MEAAIAPGEQDTHPKGVEKKSNKQVPNLRTMGYSVLKDVWDITKDAVQSLRNFF